MGFQFHGLKKHHVHHPYPTVILRNYGTQGGAGVAPPTVPAKKAYSRSWYSAPTCECYNDDR